MESDDVFDDGAPRKYLLTLFLKLLGPYDSENPDFGRVF